jgi:hypothetical protein
MKYQVGDLFRYDDGGNKTYLALIVKYKFSAYELNWFDKYAIEHFCSVGYTESMLDNDLFWRKL